jgi:hypothetical protein
MLCACDGWGMSRVKAGLECEKGVPTGGERMNAGKMRLNRIAKSFGDMRGEILREESHYYRTSSTRILYHSNIKEYPWNTKIRGRNETRK